MEPKAQTSRTYGVFKVEAEQVAEAVVRGPVYQANAGSANITGPCFVLCSDFTVALENGLNLAQRTGKKGQWYRVDYGDGTELLISFGAPAYVVAPQTNPNKNSTSLLQIASQVPRVRFGASVPGLLSPISIASGYSGSPGVGKDEWPSFTPTIGIPGAALDDGSKDSAVQGSSGYNELCSFSAAVCYVILSLWRPACGDATKDLRTPFFFAFKSQVAGSTRVPSPDTSGLRFGDLSTYVAPDKPACFVFVINELTTSIGFWLPYAELSSGGTNPYMGIDISVSGLVAPKSVPFSRLGLNPSGFVSPGVPGLETTFLEPQS